MLGLRVVVGIGVAIFGLVLLACAGQEADLGGSGDGYNFPGVYDGPALPAGFTPSTWIGRELSWAEEQTLCNWLAARFDGIDPDAAPAPDPLLELDGSPTEYYVGPAISCSMPSDGGPPITLNWVRLSQLDCVQNLFAGECGQSAGALGECVGAFQSAYATPDAGLACGACAAFEAQYSQCQETIFQTVYAPGTPCGSALPNGSWSPGYVTCPDGGT